MRDLFPFSSGLISISKLMQLSEHHGNERGYITRASNSDKKYLLIGMGKITGVSGSDFTKDSGCDLSVRTRLV